ncbi:hypothetical protein SCHPADRAFT_387251 [Schizopora paradoxa]|uniref:Uncharacterized protein n=1 Tax=Schizopora paradoxa TaxID=27342 RepID=A0A0H2RM66_9AGAM|nr:hypothetical protein SCHPADRAFT_387251 [Schizopora paradoxa]
MALETENITFPDITSQQRDFILGITDALEKYSSNSTQTSNPPDKNSLLTVADHLIGEVGTHLSLRSFKSYILQLYRLEYALRTVGSGGHGMKCVTDFRRRLRELMALLLDTRNLSSIQRKVLELEESTKDLNSALNDFIGITYNYKLIKSLEALRKILYPYHANFVSLDSKVQLRCDLEKIFVLVRTNVEKYIDDDIRIIKSAQSDEIQRYVNITVISTFLSGVTASVLQIVGPTSNGNSAIDVAVTGNASLFSSLIFSTASAAQSLLFIIWTQSFTPLPETNLPHILYAWLHRGPLISLLVSGALFSAGLVAFVYASKQDPVTSVITTCFATLQTLGILSLTALFIRDRWKFRRDNGETGEKLTKSSFLFSLLEKLERSHDEIHPSSYYPYPHGDATYRNGAIPPHDPTILAPVIPATNLNQAHTMYGMERDPRTFPMNGYPDLQSIHTNVNGVQPGLLPGIASNGWIPNPWPIQENNSLVNDAAGYIRISCRFPRDSEFPPWSSAWVFASHEI